MPDRPRRHAFVAINCATMEPDRLEANCSGSKAARPGKTGLSSCP